MNPRTAAIVVTVAICLSANPARPPVTLVASSPVASHRLPAIERPASSAAFAHLARTDPIAMLDASIYRSRSELRGFRAVMHKQERIGGTLFPPEELRIALRESPFAVLMIWTKNPRSAQVGGFSLGKVEGVLYAAGENEGNMLVWRPGALLSPITPSNPVGTPARSASRYAITEPGLTHIAERTRRAWATARDHDRLVWEYVGEKSVPAVGGRRCHVIRRTCQPAEVDPFLSAEPQPTPTPGDQDAFATVTIMLDAETWLQVGSEQHNEAGELVGAYYFREVEQNPAFGPDQFKVSALKK